LRRVSAVRVLRKLGPSEADVEILTNAWRTFEDPEVLFALTRITDGLAAFSCCGLLEVTSRRINDQDAGYLNAAILERLILDKQLDHEHAVDSHTIPYVRAAGRVLQRELEPLLLLAIPRLNAPDALMLAASVAGRLRSQNLIAAIESQLSTLIGSETCDEPSGD
jgi:hypothetical protein